MLRRNNRRADSSKPGPKVNPESKHQLSLASRFLNRETKKQKRTQLPDCDYVTAHGGTSCCQGYMCSVQDHYSPELVQSLRGFLLRLSHADRCTFWEHRSEFDPKPKGRQVLLVGHISWKHLFPWPQNYCKLVMARLLFRHHILIPSIQCVLVGFGG